ncbi:FAD-dependent oxidoreductase [Thioclava sp. BHET1]|nr:FAD-dependent oxidoreductase [Thioclava sp. BHET1]
MDSDFLIIGGGIAGVSAAARLSHLGSVTLLEAEDTLAHHASSRSAALYEPNYGLPPVLELTRASRAHLAEAEGGVLSPRGLMIVGNPEELLKAAGPWADHVAGLAGLAPLGLTPYRRSMARIPAPGGHDVSRWPMLFGVGESWYAKPDAGALIVSPAEEDPMEPHDAFADDMVLAEGLARYEEMVTEPVTRLLANWAGLRTFAPDRVLVIGPDPRDGDFLWSAGQGGYGFQTAPAASRLLADLAAGQAPEIASATVQALAPGRLLA